MEQNNVLYDVLISETIDDYAYKDDHFRKDEKNTKNFDDNKVSCNKHDMYIEAIVGAIYCDSGFEKTKRWINEWLLPRLEKNKVV